MYENFYIQINWYAYGIIFVIILKNITNVVEYHSNDSGDGLMMTNFSILTHFILNYIHPCVT